MKGSKSSSFIHQVTRQTRIADGTSCVKCDEKHWVKQELTHRETEQSMVSNASSLSESLGQIYDAMRGIRRSKSSS